MTDEDQARRIADQLAMRQMADEIERLRELQAHKRAQAEERLMVVTHAQLARDVGHIGRLAANAMEYLSDGMWNPDFCSADCSSWAASLCKDLRALADHIERKAKPKTEAKSTQP